MGGPKNVTSTSKSEPWSESKPYIKNLYSAAQDAFNMTNKQMYTGDLWAQPTQTQIGANQQLKDNVWNIGAPELRNLGLDTVSGKYLNPETNPYLKAAADAAAGDVSRNYARNVLPNMGSAAIRGGAYGGSRQGIQEGLAAGEYAREASEATNNMYYQNYASERDRQMQSGNLFNQANALEAANLQGITAAGAQEQAWNQAQNMENYQRYQMAQQAPWIGVPELQSVLMGGNFQSTSQTAPNPNYMNPAQIAMGAGSLLTGLMGAGFGGGGQQQGQSAGYGQVDPWAGMRAVTAR
jgi:hypothetical protein